MRSTYGVMKMAPRTASILLISSLALLAGGCTRYHVQVNGFQNPEQPLPQTATYSIIPLENQKNDLEFMGYARMVERKLQERGYKKAEARDADLVIILAYGVDQGTTKAFAYSVPQYGTSNFSGSAFGSSGTTFFSGTSYGIVGSQTYAGSYVEHQRTLIIDVIDIARYRKDGTIVSVWQGRINRTGSSGDLRRVMPYMIEAGFRHWGEDTKLGIRHVIFEDESAIVKLREDKQ